MLDDDVLDTIRENCEANCASMSKTEFLMLIAQAREANALRAELAAARKKVGIAERSISLMLEQHAGLEAECTSLRREAEEMRAKAGLADEIAVAYRETASLRQWQIDWLTRYSALSPAPRKEAEMAADEYDLENTDFAMLCASERFHLFGGKLLTILNDTFAWASADCEEVEPEHIEEVARLFRRYGDCGLIYWASKRRNWSRSAFKDINRMIDFVRAEEDQIAREPNSSKRAYMDLPGATP